MIAQGSSSGSGERHAGRPSFKERLCFAQKGREGFTTKRENVYNETIESLDLWHEEESTP